MTGLIAKLRDAPLQWLGGALGAAVLVISGLFGGLDDVGEPPTPATDLNIVSLGEPWNVKITGGRVILGDLPPLRLSTPGNRWLAVIAEVEITADESRIDIDDIIRLPTVTGLVKDSRGKVPERAGEIRNMRDSSPVSILHPRMPEKIAFFWELEAGAPVPTTLDVAIWEKSLRRGFAEGAGVWPEDGRLLWKDAVARAQVEIPLQAVDPDADASAGLASAGPSAGLSSRRPSTGATPTPSRPASPTPSRAPSATPSRTR